MKLTVNKTAIVRALADLSGAISTKTTLPILGNVKFTVEGQRLEMEATDLDLSVRCAINVDDPQNGSSTLPAKRLLGLLREIPTESAKIEVDGSNAATVVSGSSKFRLLGLPAEDFPSMGSESASAAFDLIWHELSGALKRVSYATSTDESRYVLNGVLLQSCETGWNLIGTDGRRLAIATIDGPCEPIEAILPNKAVSMLKSLDEAEIVSVSIGSSWAEFSTPSLTIRTKLIEGNFPNWRQVMPSQKTFAAQVEREVLLGSIRRVGMMANEKTNAIVLDFSEGQVDLSAITPDVGEARETIGAENAGALKIAVNPLFAQQCLAALSADKVTLDLIDESSPIVVRDTNFQYILMPMRA